MKKIISIEDYESLREDAYILDLLKEAGIKDSEYWKIMLEMLDEAQEGLEPSEYLD